MATAARRFLTLGAVLLLLLGIARGSGGIALVLRGPSVVDSSRASPQVASLLGIALLLVAAGAIIAGLALLRGSAMGMAPRYRRAVRVRPRWRSQWVSALRTSGRSRNPGEPGCGPPDPGGTVAGPQ